MPVYCSYHSAHYAAFNCPKCRANLCPSCVVKKKNAYYGYSRDVYLCPKCTMFVEKLSFTHAIEPFWMRLPSIFHYPLHLQPMALIIALSLLLAFFTDKTPTGLIASILCFGIILTYSCLALASSANGRLTPPPISISSISKNFSLFFKFIGLYFLIGFTGYQLNVTLLPFLGLEPSIIVTSVFALIALLLLPAMIIVLAVTKSLIAAILPQSFILLAWRIGWPYLAMYFFLTILFSAPTILVRQISDTLPTHVLIFLTSFFTSYYMIVSYHLMGYILFQYHAQVGYDVAYEGDFHSVSSSTHSKRSASPQTSNPDETILDKVNMMIRDGDYDAAISEIQQSTRGCIQDPILADRYYSLLRLRKRNMEMASFAPDYIRLMLKTNQKDKICAAYLFGSQIRPDMLEDDPATLFSVARTLYDHHYDMEALKLLDRFVQAHPDHAMTANSYFLIARIFNERLNDPLRASRILEWLNKKYPFHENAAFVQSYARQIKV